MEENHDCNGSPVRVDSVDADCAAAAGHLLLAIESPLLPALRGGGPGGASFCMLFKKLRISSVRMRSISAGASRRRNACRLANIAAISGRYAESAIIYSMKG
jgi:hypothetical protein